ncbi:MAG TPA: hypothetical protein VEV16_00335 [Daejeonella sp.]|nr:hypothetical protein [Daejeonella sp.]
MKTAPANIKKYDLLFSQYCNIDTASNHEFNAVLSNIYGDYKHAVLFAGKKNKSSLSIAINTAQLDSIKANLEFISKDSGFSLEDKLKASQMLSLLSPPSLDHVFNSSKAADARSVILEQSKNFHFLLINEAHYSSQNRAFTHSLLKPLWEQGYRYLALEDLGYDDLELIARGSPNIHTGYYLKDPVFSALVRDALKMGYQLVPYETKGSEGGTIRDRDQALNIYKSTLQKDTVGKVIIHAGYSHISKEGGDPYIPMGAQLKALIRQDILTVDQVTMVELSDDKLHSYYKHVKNNFTFSDPIVVLDSNSKPLIDPVNSQGIDIQIYHPPTIYKYNRPLWLLNKENYSFIKVPNELQKYKGYLLQVLRKEAEYNEIPIDQIVIGNDTRLVLSPSDYKIRLISREGNLEATGLLTIR